MPSPDPLAIAIYFALVVMGVMVQLSARYHWLEMLTSSKWKHPLGFIALWLGLALAMASLAQNAHSIFLVHLGFGLTYLFLLLALLWIINACANATTKAGWVLAFLLIVAGIGATVLFHIDKIRSLRPVRPTPLFTIKVSNSAFPVSVPSRSTLLILPLHPYQTFTDAASRLHEYENDCAEARNWPSPEEINSKAVNGYEEVRHIEVTNHSQNSMESGRVVFDILYGKSFAGECSTPPASATPQQHDVVSIPALDPGKSFEFVAVNQSDRCAWLLTPTQIGVKMATDENAMDVPLKFEKRVVPALASLPFGPTAIKWYGVPIKNPGYGMVRSGSDCRLPNDGKRRDIQHKLALLMREGSVIRIKWGQMMGYPEMEKLDAIEVRDWHARIERYISTLPRSDFYLARLKRRS
jgi:hypothetical protein